MSLAALQGRTLTRLVEDVRTLLTQGEVPSASLGVLETVRAKAVFEQLRDTGKAAAFLRAYLKAVPDDPWATSKAEHFRALGLV